jgi:hypothetical protein
MVLVELTTAEINEWELLKDIYTTQYSVIFLR